MFDYLLSKYEKERIECDKSTATLTADLADAEKMSFDIDRWIALVKGYMNIQEIDRNLLINLIDKIIVSEKIKVNSKKTQDIYIIYNFVGDIG